MMKNKKGAKKVDENIYYSLVPIRRGVGIIGGPGKIRKTKSAVGWRRLENSPKFNYRLFVFKKDCFGFHLYKTNINIESLCWMKFFPKFNSRGR